MSTHPFRIAIIALRVITALSGVEWATVAKVEVDAFKFLLTLAFLCLAEFKLANGAVCSQLSGYLKHLSFASSIVSTFRPSLTVLTCALLSLERQFAMKPT